ncbi:MAG: transposase [Deltaproteobacteria bacterium]|nr:transposase [Deltaproteobacteria bacterium]
MILNIFEELSKVAKNPPKHKKCKNIATKFEEHGDYYKTFVFYPDIGPTNNAVERALRSIVIDRYITRGTRGPAGRHFCEPVWSASQTRVMNGYSFYKYLKEAIHAYYSDQPIPSLLTLKDKGGG